jgi:hypothetical protein
MCTAHVYSVCVQRICTAYTTVPILTLARKLAFFSSDSSAFAKDLLTSTKVLLVYRLTTPKPSLLVYNKQELYIDFFTYSLSW